MMTDVKPVQSHDEEPIESNCSYSAPPWPLLAPSTC
jgi:hypothetical protein